MFLDTVLCASTLSTEIPEDMSQFDVLQTSVDNVRDIAIFLTEHVGESYFKRPLQGSKVEKDGPMEGGRSQTRAEEHNLEVTQKTPKRKFTHLVLHRVAEGQRESFGDEVQRNDPSKIWRRRKR